MRIAAHREKVRRIDAARSRLDPERDLELWLWSSASVGNHALNAILHHLGITEQDDVYPTQVAGVYVAFDAPGAEPRRLVKPPGDVLHLGMPPLDRALPASLDAACEALALIEATAGYRIRGGESVSADTIRECARAYALFMDAFDGALQSLRE